MLKSEPRTAVFCGRKCPPSLFGGGTWLEAEEFCYPSGGKTRRAKARTVEGKLKVVWCGIPDTYWTIPCKGGGYLSVEDEVVVYHARCT